MTRPQRPPSHELKSLSDRAFAAALPGSLVVRDLEQDEYGIDREVEVFVDGEATGLTFKVQLKGTSKSGAKRRVKRSSLSYWLSLDVPVLLVSWESSTGTLRGRWAHSIAADLSADGPEKITVDLDRQIGSDTDWAAGLAADLNVLRELRAGYVPSKVPVSVEATSGVGDLDVPFLRTAMLQVSRRGQRPFRLASKDDWAVTFTLSADRLRISMPLDWSTVVMRNPAPERSPEGLRVFAEELVLLTSTLLARVDVRAGHELMLSVDPAAPVWRSLDLVLQLHDVLCDPESSEFLFQVIAAIASDEDLSEEEFAALEGLEHLLRFVPLHGLEDEMFDRYVDDRSRLARKIAAADVADCGRQLYNLGHLLKARHDYSRALELFHEAASMQPRYADDPEFLRHRAGCEWEVGAFGASADSYQCADDAGYTGPDVLPLRADSLMYAGRFGEAGALLSTWEPAGGPFDRVGQVNRVLIDQLRNRLGLESQDRAPLDGLESVPDDADPSMLPVAGSSDVEQLLRDSDALDPRLWSALVDLDEVSDSFPALLFVAVFAQGVPDFWAAAAVGALAAGADDEVVRAIMDCGRFHCGDDFYKEMLRAANANDDEKAAVLRQLASAAFSDEPYDFGVVWRLVSSAEDDPWVVERFDLPSDVG